MFCSPSSCNSDPEQMSGSMKTASGLGHGSRMHTGTLVKNRSVCPRCGATGFRINDRSLQREGAFSLQVRQGDGGQAAFCGCDGTD